jgi:hypothetical protein
MFNAVLVACLTSSTFASPSATDICAGCVNSLSGNFDASGVFDVDGPLGSSVKVTVTTNVPGICEPDCDVESVCEFGFDYELEFGPHGVGWERTDAVRTTAGTSFFNQGVKRVAPGPGLEVQESVGPVDVACGHEVLYYFKNWFNQPVPTGTASDPKVWQAGPVSFTCSACR